MSIKLPVSDLSRATTHEPDDNWPEEIRIVVKFSKNRSKTLVIGADEYFGRGSYGAPMNGDTLIQRIDQLRRMKG